MPTREPGLLSTLHQVLRALADENDSRRVHESLVQGALAVCPTAGALTVSLNPATNELTLEAQSGLAVREPGALPAAVRRAIDERRVLTADDARLPVPDGEPLRSLTALPIVRERRAEAALVLGHAPGHRRLSPDELQVLDVLLTMGGVALAHATTATTSARRMATLEEHAAALRRVALPDRRDAIIERALDVATTLLGADRAAIFFVDDHGAMRLMCARRLSRRYLEAVVDTYKGGPGGLLLRTISPLYIPDMATDPRSRPIHEAARLEGIHTGLFVPFVRENQVFGALALYHDIPWQYPEQDIALVRSFADQLGVSMADAEERDRMRTRLARFEMASALGRALAANPGEQQLQVGLAALVAAGVPCAWLYRQGEDGEPQLVARAGASPLNPRLPADAATVAMREARGADQLVQGAHRLVAAQLPGLSARWALVLNPPRARAPEPRPGTTMIELSTGDDWRQLVELATFCASQLAVATVHASPPPPRPVVTTAQP